MKKHLPKTVNNSSGFSLVELLVVISIIAILSAIGFTVYSNLGAAAKARNNVRKADLESIARALEVNKPTGKDYVVLAASQFSNNAIPTDPGTYSYCANSTASSQPADPVVWTSGTCPANFGAIGEVNPPAGTKWKICASLEAEVNPVVVAKVVCKISTQ